jgi:hypothetical protein
MTHPQHLLDIRHRPDGTVVIKRHPFETVLNMDEWKELSEYCATHSSQQAEQGLWTADELIQHEKMAADAAREKVLDELGKVLNSRIAKMEILDSKNPSPFRKGIIEAYRDIEKWEMARRHEGKDGEPIFISCNTPAHTFRLDLKNKKDGE